MVPMTKCVEVLETLEEEGVSVEEKSIERGEDATEEGHEGLPEPIRQESELCTNFLVEEEEIYKRWDDE